MEKFIEWLHYASVFQINKDWRFKINHVRDRKIIINVLVIVLIWIITNASLSWMSRDTNFGEIYLVSFFTYLIAADFAAITFSFHYIFFIASLLNRFSNFVKNFKQIVVSRRGEKLIKALDDFIFTYSTFECLIERMNLIFRLQVIEFKVKAGDFSRICHPADNFRTLIDTVIKCDSHFLAGSPVLQGREYFS